MRYGSFYTSMHIYEKIQLVQEKLEKMRGEKNLAKNNQSCQKLGIFLFTVYMYVASKKISEHSK